MASFLWFDGWVRFRLLDRGRYLGDLITRRPLSILLFFFFHAFFFTNRRRCTGNYALAYSTGPLVRNEISA